MLHREAFDAINDVFEVALPLWKAVPVAEGPRRFIYCEPSNENWDADDERVLKKALTASADYFLKFGNLDISHLTRTGYSLEIPNPERFEIGRPVELKDVDGHLLMKGEIYRGEGMAAEVPNYFWSSITEMEPRRIWYPSVGGYRTVKRSGPECRKTIVGTTWNNVAFAHEPRNHSIGPVTTIAPDEFLKAVTAGYGTDMATLTGGAALRRQSLQGVPLPTDEADDRVHFRTLSNRFLRALGSSQCPHTGTDRPSAATIADHFERCEGELPARAAEYADRLIADIAQQLREAA